MAVETAPSSKIGCRLRSLLCECPHKFLPLFLLMGIHLVKFTIPCQIFWARHWCYRQPLGGRAEGESASFGNSSSESASPLLLMGISSEKMVSHSC